MLSEDATVPPNTALAVWLRLEEYGECVVPTRTLAAGWSQLGGDRDAWREGPWHALTLARDPTVLQPAVCQAAQLGATQTGEDQAIELLLAASGTAPNRDARDCIDALVRERMVDSIEPACSAWADGQAEASELPPSWALRSLLGPWRQVKRASFGYFGDDGRPIDPHPGLMDEIVGKIPEPEREAAQLVVCADSSRHLADRETWAISEPEPPYTQGYPWGDPFRAVTQLRVIEAYGESCPARCAAATLSRHTGDMRHWNKSLNAYDDDVWRVESTLASVRIAKRRMKRNLPTYEGLMPGAEAELLDGTVGWWLVREHQRDCLAGREGEERCASTARQAHGYDNWEGNLPGWSREVDGHIGRFCRTTLPAMKAPPSAEEFTEVMDNVEWLDDGLPFVFYAPPPDTHAGSVSSFEITEKQLQDAYERSWPQAWKGASEKLCSDLGSLGFLRLTCSVEEGEDRPENCLYTVPLCVEMMQDWCPD